MIYTREMEKVENVEREQVRFVELKRPEHVGNRWTGIKHEDLLESIDSKLEERGIKKLSERLYLNHHGAGMIGYMKVQVPHVQSPEGLDFCLGFKHSNDAQVALKFVVGAQVFVCSNGVVTGEHLISRLHTKGLNLNESIDKGLDKYMIGVQGIQTFVNTLKEKELNDQNSDKILMETGRQGLLPWSRIGLVDKEFRNPRFSEFSEKNAWSLYNAFTYTVQKSRPAFQISAIKKFGELILN